MDIERRLEEYRAAGWSEQDLAGFRRGYEAASASTGHNISMSAPPAPDPAPYLQPDQFRGFAKGDRGRWQRESVAGRLRHALGDDPDADARELAAAKKFREDYEWVYGRAPSMAEARFAVRPRGGELVVLSGGYEDLRRVFAVAGLRFGRTDVSEPLSAAPGSVTHQPVSRG
jgi:hypothetical protein